MVVRQLKEKEYDRLQEKLIKDARNKPSCPIFEVDIIFNGEKYTLFLQPEKDKKIYALYALNTVYENDVYAVNHMLITNNIILSSLMEMVIYQWIKMG